MPKAVVLAYEFVAVNRGFKIMPRMLELIRASAVPSNLMQSAARGALSVPPQEMIEILVHLATKNKVFSEQASLTLAGGMRLPLWQWLRTLRRQKKCWII